MVSDDATAEAKAANAAEMRARDKIINDPRFQIIIKFVNLITDAACNNKQLLTGEFSFLKSKNGTLFEELIQFFF